MTRIAADMKIGLIILIKGIMAGEIIDQALCDAEKTCCPGTTVQLGAATKIKGKEEKLPKLLDDLNSLPDTPEWKKSQE